MRVLADFHHHALAESLAVLFSDRFGAELFFPAGMDWFAEGYWAFEKEWHGDRVARQYLDGIWANATTRDGLELLTDPRHPGRMLRGVTLAAAREMTWDLVLSTLPANDAGLHRFSGETGARFGVQLGNNGQDSRLDLATFILASTTLAGREPDTADPAAWGRVMEYAGLPTVVYHQEFDLGTFRAGAPAEADRRTIASFVNCFPETPVYSSFLALARSWGDLADWKVYGSYGSAAPDEYAAGDISWVPAVADAMRAARIGWHSKYWGDGFGHVAHNWAAVGRPLLVSRRYYVDKLAGALFVEGDTAWDIDAYSPEELRRIVVRLQTDDAWYAERCAAMAGRFRELVDFDKEADAIRSVLGL